MTETASPEPDLPPIVIGIGASAGGLEAFLQFLTGVPDDHQMVLVLIQHLDPDHDSLMPELVAAKTSSPVHSVQNNMQTVPGNIYLIPPGFEMDIKGDRLLLKEFESPRGLRRPIDRFFKGLAREHGENAVAVVLSGTGSDGSEGAREIKGAGGLVFVQDPNQAKYDGMPQSVLDAGGADVISRAEEVIDVVRDYFSLRVATQNLPRTQEDFLSRVLRHVRFRSGHDFSDYKHGTMLRRIAVRMSVLNLISSAEYLKYIAEHKQEADILFQDILINVTSFFRDKDHFNTINNDVIPQIVESCEEHGEIRIWVPGCSTGEEAYSLAILFAEEVGRAKRNCRVVVFATDIDEVALVKARGGCFPESISTAIPDEYLDRYFRPRADGYEVGPQLREIVRFSRHSFVKDPPFSKLNMVSCRNVLIYFGESLQETAIKVFHYALKEDGFLFIGPSENPRLVSELFTDVSTKARVFKRRPGVAKPLSLGSLSGATKLPPIRDTQKIDPIVGATTLERALLDHHLPPHLHMDRNGNVIFTSENATRFLAVRPGKMSSALTSIIAPELESAIRRLSRVDEQVGTLLECEFQGEISGREERLVLAATRLADGGVLIVFHDKLLLHPDRPSITEGGDQADIYLKQIETELDQARESVRTTIEELETSNEELKSSNEEMMSMNEELQSANEELTTINDELQEKVRALNQAHTDLTNFTESARIATVFLDSDLKLKHFTPEAKDYFTFAEGDIGRKMADLNSALDQDKLLKHCKAALENQEEYEHEFATKDDTANLAVRIMPYSPDGGAERGVVFTLQDVTELRDAIEFAEDMQREAEKRLNEVEQMYRTSPMAMTLIDKNMRYVRVNQKMADINGEPIASHIGATVREIVPGVAEHTENAVRQVLETKEAARGVKIHGAVRSDPNNTRVWESDWVPFYDGDELSAVSISIRDITEQEQTSENLRRIMRELEHRVKNMLANVTALVNQARREVTTDKEVYAKLTRRIDGLANTHSLLTSEQWSSALISDIIVPETSRIYGEDRVFLKGPEIRVNSRATLALGMAIHELATNAAKYGAFSTETGKVSISWSRINDAESDRLVIEWKEQGGPPVTAPTRRGFGSQLISSTLEQSLDGKTSSTWDREGLIFTAEMDFGEVSGVDAG